MCVSMLNCLLFYMSDNSLSKLVFLCRYKPTINKHLSLSLSLSLSLHLSLVIWLRATCRPEIVNFTENLDRTPYLVYMKKQPGIKGVQVLKSPLTSVSAFFLQASANMLKNLSERGMWFCLYTRSPKRSKVMIGI